MRVRKRTQGFFLTSVLLLLRLFVVLQLLSAVVALTDKPSGDESSFEEEEGFIKTKKASLERSSSPSHNDCVPSSIEPKLLQNPCELDDAQIDHVPSEFSLVFPTQYGSFTANCVRDRAPIWADRVYKLAKNGYYNENYFFRVIPGRYVQFGTNGIPSLSNVYNYTTTEQPECSILSPQPPEMPYCLAHHRIDRRDCEGVPALSNTFGTLSMSTSYQQGIEGYPNGVTWNATAELFLNIGNNQVLDANLFIPICTVSRNDMKDVVMKFPSFGEVAELGGDGPSLGRLYEEGNSYIASNVDWNETMAITSVVSVCSKSTDDTGVAPKTDVDAETPDILRSGEIHSGKNSPLFTKLSSFLWKGVVIWWLSWIVFN